MGGGQQPRLTTKDGVDMEIDARVVEALYRAALEQMRKDRGGK